MSVYIEHDQTYITMRTETKKNQCNTKIYNATAEAKERRNGTRLPEVARALYYYYSNIIALL